MSIGFNDEICAISGEKVAKRLSTAKRSFRALSAKENLAEHQHQSRVLSARSVR